MFIFTLFAAFLLVVSADGAEWDCKSTSNTGIYIRSSACSIVGGVQCVDVTSTLEITGINVDMNNLVTITAPANGRHFHIATDGRLKLSHLKLSGGNINSGGGSINIVGGGQLDLYSSIIYENKGHDGGGIASYGSSEITVFNCVIVGNEATRNGGGLYAVGFALRVYNSIVSNNSAGSQGGGLAAYYNDDLQFYNTTISNNNALLAGGGIYI